MVTQRYIFIKACVFSLIFAGIISPAYSTNIAPYGTATADSSFNTNLPEMAIDSNLSTFWNASSHGSLDKPHWLMIDLKYVYPITSIVVSGDDKTKSTITNGFNNNYNLYISVDGSTWTKVGSGTITESSKKEEYSDIIKIPRLPARYVKYEVVGGTHWSFLNEIEIYSDVQFFALSETQPLNEFLTIPQTKIVVKEKEKKVTKDAEKKPDIAAVGRRLWEAVQAGEITYQQALTMLNTLW